MDIGEWSGSHELVGAGLQSTVSGLALHPGPSQSIDANQIISCEVHRIVVLRRLRKCQGELIGALRRCQVTSVF